MQEFLASYAVQVDEDGARRLQAILDQNRDSAKDLAASFASADAALTALKKNLSDAAGLKNILSALNCLAGLLITALTRVLDRLGTFGMIPVVLYLGLV